jgi:3-deoxy-7-phosphoheptulonate synthase
MALAALVVGAHGVMIEVHPDPERALSDGPQSLDFKTFERLAGQLARMETFLHSSING